MSPNYNNTVIYKIVSNDQNINDIYVGSTTDFNKRKRQHKTDCNNVNSKQHNLKVYQIIRQNGGWEEWMMIKIEDYPCTSWNEAHTRERHYYNLLVGTMNSQVPTRTQKEYYETNKDHLSNKHKQYYINNKDKINGIHKQYYEANKDKINGIHKQYYEANKEHIYIKQKQYNEANKEKKKQYDKQRYFLKKNVITI